MNQSSRHQGTTSYWSSDHPVAMSVSCGWSSGPRVCRSNGSCLYAAQVGRQSIDGGMFTWISGNPLDSSGIAVRAGKRLLSLIMSQEGRRAGIGVHHESFSAASVGLLNQTNINKSGRGALGASASGPLFHPARALVYAFPMKISLGFFYFF